MNRVIAVPSLIVMACMAVSADADRREGFCVAGYLPDYRFEGLQLDRFNGLTDLYIFSVEPFPDGSLDLSRVGKCPWTAIASWKARQDARVFVTVGGWGRSEHFAGVAQDPVKRRRCIDQMLRLCRVHDLDGVDIDWEHPEGDPQVTAHGELLREMHKAFEPRGLVVSVTVAPWQSVSPMAVAAADRIQVMSYDHGGEHATLDAARADLMKWVAAGVPNDKLVLGLPFYGRSTRTRAAMTYRTIVRTFAPQPAVNRVNDVFFNGPDLIRQKTAMVKRGGYAGVMIWEISQDAPGNAALLRVITDELRMGDDGDGG